MTMDGIANNDNLVQGVAMVGMANNDNMVQDVTMLNGLGCNREADSFFLFPLPIGRPHNNNKTGVWPMPPYTTDAARGLDLPRCRSNYIQKRNNARKKN